MVWAGHDVVVLEVSEPRVCSQQMSSSGSTPHSCRHLPALALVGGCQEPKHLSNRKMKHLWFWIWMGFSWHQWANAGCSVGIQRQEWHAGGIGMQAGHIPAGISLPTLEGNSWVKVESWDLELISWGALSSKSTTVWACEYKFTGASGWHLTNSSLLEGNERGANCCLSWYPLQVLVPYSPQKYFLSSCVHLPCYSWPKDMLTFGWK